MTRRAVAVVAAVVATVTGFTGPSGASSSGSQVGGGLRLLDRTPWVGEGVDFEMSVLIQGAPEGGQLQMTLHDRVRSRSEFARSLEGEGLRSRLAGPSPVPVADLDADGDGAVPLRIPLVAREGQTPIPLPRPGVYPVVVELLETDGEPSAVLRTHLVRLPAPDPDSGVQPLRVATVLRLDAPPAHLDPAGPRPPDLELEAVATTFARHPAVPLTLVPTPESIAAADASAPDAVAALGDALQGREVLAGPWVDLDEAAWVRADDAERRRQLTRGRETLASLLGQEPGPARLVAGEVLDPQVDAAVTGGATAVVVDEAGLEPLDPDDFPYTPGRPFVLDTDAGTEVPALASDEALADLAGGAAEDPVLAAHHVLADLAVIANDEPESPRVATLVVPEDAAASPIFLDELLAGLEPPPGGSAPVVVGATVSTALAEVEPAGAGGGASAEDPLHRALRSDGPVGAVVDLAGTLAAARTELGSLRTIFGPGDPLASQIELVLATAASTELGATARAGALSAVDGVVDARLAGLRGPEQQQVTLTAREGRVQVVLTNETGRAADLVLQLRGDRLVFPDAPNRQVAIRLTESTTRIDLRIEARSSGDAPLDLRLTSPDGQIVLGSTRITVRTTAFSGVGIFLMAAAAAFLILWWSRTILRERRAAQRRHPAHAGR